MGTNTDLTDSSNAFAKSNSSITASLLNVASADRDNFIDFMTGIDVYDDNLNGETTDKRDWLLGSFLHSRPKMVFYGNQGVIYAGSNDGMLHAFDDNNGRELWAFIPPEFLGRLQELHTDNPGIFVDGSPTAYVSYDSDGSTVNKAILIFGMRRGGNKYYALDVTDYNTPKIAWKIDPNTMSQYVKMGQTWSIPMIGQISGGQYVAFIGGGYDTNQDGPNAGSDQYGTAIYVVNVLDGSLVKRFSSVEDSTMNYSIPGDIAKLDLDGDGKVDRLYVGDMNGRMWRFGSDDPDPNADKSDVTKWKGKIIFKSNSTSGEKRKIFYPPDITLEGQDGVNYEMLFFGTGNREDPNGYTDSDRLYGVKDKNSGLVSGWTTLGESNLVDVTNFYTDATVRTAILNDKTKFGWYMQLDRNAGEKCLSSPLTYNRVAYYTTFAPTQGIQQGDLCFVGEGTATLYELNYSTGEAVWNLDLTNDVGGTVISKSDRGVKIGTAIPSGVVVTVIGGKVTAYAGVGGGVARVKLTSTKVMFPLTWKLVF